MSALLFTFLRSIVRSYIIHSYLLKRNRVWKILKLKRRKLDCFCKKWCMQQVRLPNFKWYPWWASAFRNWSCNVMQMWSFASYFAFRTFQFAVTAGRRMCGTGKKKRVMALNKQISSVYLYIFHITWAFFSMQSGPIGVMLITLL